MKEDEEGVPNESSEDKNSENLLPKEDSKEAAVSDNDIEAGAHNASLKKENAFTRLRKRTAFHKTVNWFVGFFVFVSVLFTVLLGFSQTSTFRKFVKNKVVAILNTETKGTFAIGELDGSFFTTLTLRNILLTFEGDTVARVEKIDLRFSPLALLRKTIRVRDFSIHYPVAVMETDSTGVVNFSKIFPSKPDTDTTSSSFPFKISVGNFEIVEGTFRVMDWDYRDSVLPMNALNMKNLRLDKLNLKSRVRADIDNKDFELNLANLSASCNIKTVPEAVISGDFAINRKIINIQNFKINAPQTALSLNLETEGLDLFGKITSEIFAKTQLNLRLNLEKFSFADLETFVPAVDMLRGNLSGELSASGIIHKIDIEKLALKYDSTSLQLKGVLENLDKPSELLISADMTKSRLLMRNVEDILPMVTLAPMPGFEMIQIDSLSFHGKPLDFNSSAKLLASGGVLRMNAKMDFTKAETKYTVAVDAGNMDLKGLAHFPVNLNGKAKIEGSGFDPKKAILDCEFNGDYSTIGSKNFSHLFFSSQIKEGKLAATMRAISAEDSLLLHGSADFIIDTLVVYQVGISMFSFNLGTLLNDTALTSNINLDFQIDAKGLRPDDISGNASLRVTDSRLLARDIQLLTADCLIKKTDGNNREISLRSNLADINIKGDFSIPDFISSVAFESMEITDLSFKKLRQLFPSIVAPDSVLVTIPEKEIKRQQLITYRVAFDCAIKDTQQINYLLPDAKLKFDGDIEGSATKTTSAFNFFVSADARTLKLENQDNAFLADNCVLKTALYKPLAVNSLEKVKFEVSCNASHLFMGQTLSDVVFRLKLNNGVAALSGSTGIRDNIKTGFSASMNLLYDSLYLKCDTLMVRYNQFEMKNTKSFMVSYRNNDILIHDFELTRGNSLFKADGRLSFDRENDLALELVNFAGYDISYNLLGISPNEVINNKINLKLNIKGTQKAPLMTMALDVDSVSYRSTNFGSLKGNFAYKDQKLSTDVRFVDYSGKERKERFYLTGSLPINLGFSDVKERISNTEPVDLHFQATEFNIASLASFASGINRLSGLINANVDIGGTLNNIRPNGFLRATDVTFHVIQNNLDYSSGMHVTLKNEVIAIDSFVVQNASKVKNKGRLSGHGTIETTSDQGLNISAILQGDLTVLSEDSKTSNSSIYGNLFVGIDGELTINVTKDRTFLYVPLIIKESNVIFPSTQSSYSSSGDNFIYRAQAKNVTLSRYEQEIQRLNALAAEKKLNTEIKGSTSSFDYEIKVKIQKEANFVFLLSPETNLKLNAVLKGDVIFERKDGIQNFQGELKVLDGSTLEFFKTFTATGSVRFESDLTNPNLDIVGMYKAYYQKSDTNSATGGKEDEVAVKVRLTGPLHDLAKNFSQNTNNIAIYVGSSNIEKEISSPELDKADAVWFILTGKFTRDLSAQEKSKAATQIDPITGTATSLAGSVLAGVLNSYLGDYVRSIDLRNNGTGTVFNLSGRFKDFRYTFGGSTNFLQDLSAANVRIEYPLSESFSIRLERRQSVTETNYQNEMINELGLRYRVEF